MEKPGSSSFGSPMYSPQMNASGQNVVAQPVHPNHRGNLINQHQLDGRTGNFSQTSQGILSAPYIVGLPPSYAGEGGSIPIWNTNNQQVEITQNVVDQLVHQGYRDNLINQHQLASHTGNFSQASQGNVSMPPITGVRPSYTAEGFVNPIWNYDTQQAKSLPQNILDQQTHPGCGGNLINQHQQDGHVGNFSQPSQGIVSMPHITGSVLSYAAQGAVNPISNSYTQQSKSDNDLSKSHPFASSTQVPMDSFLKNDDLPKWNAFESTTQRVPVNPFLDTDDLLEWDPSESGPGQVTRNPSLNTNNLPVWNPSESGRGQVTRNPSLDIDDLLEWNPSELSPDTHDLLEWNPTDYMLMIPSLDDLPERNSCELDPQQLSVNASSSQGNQNQNLNAFGQQNLTRRPIVNTLYDPEYALHGKSVDPHLRLFLELRDKGRNGGNH